MDSRLLYSAASHLDSIIKWDKDWIHFGTSETIQFDLIIKIINEFLKDEPLCPEVPNRTCCSGTKGSGSSSK